MTRGGPAVTSAAGRCLLSTAHSTAAVHLLVAVSGAALALR